MSYHSACFHSVNTKCIGVYHLFTQNIEYHKTAKKEIGLYSQCILGKEKPSDFTPKAYAYSFLSLISFTRASYIFSSIMYFFLSIKNAIPIAIIGTSTIPSLKVNL